MEQNREFLQRETYPAYYIGIQTLLNNLLKQMVAGKIKNTTDLIYTVKEQWRQIDIYQFEVTYHYVTTMIAIMDETMKLLPAFPFIGSRFSHDIEDVYLAGVSSEDQSYMEAWIFFTGTNEKKQLILFKAMHLLEITYGKEKWLLKGIDITTGEKFLRMKK